MLRLSMYYDVSIKEQLEKILNNAKLFNNKDKINDSYHTCDITDGNIYKNLLKTDDGKQISTKNAYTFTLNTDGIAVSFKSNLTIWPIYLVINEIPLEQRYCIDNIIIAGTCIIFNN